MIYPKPYSTYLRETISLKRLDPSSIKDPFLSHLSATPKFRVEGT